MSEVTVSTLSLIVHVKDWFVEQPLMKTIRPRAKYGCDLDKYVVETSSLHDKR
jgi:hypothetical protein